MLDPESLLRALGPYVLIGLCLIVFAECGLLVGFLLPGDSLLFTAGLLVANGVIDVPLWLVCTVLVVAALLGNVCGYWIGRKAGPACSAGPTHACSSGSTWRRPTRSSPDTGPGAVVLGRFVPIVRTFITVMAGVGRMETRKYLAYSSSEGSPGPPA